MVNKYLPWNKFRLLDGTMFQFGQSTWKNPALATTPADCISVARGNTAKVARGERSEGQVKSAWHKFWFAVHRLGVHVYGSEQASQGEVDLSRQGEVDLWTPHLVVKLRPDIENFYSVKKTFQEAGLLDEGALGDGEHPFLSVMKKDVRQKFLLAETVIKHYNLSAAPKIVKKEKKRGPDDLFCQKGKKADS